MSVLHTGRGVFWYAVLVVLAPHRGSPHTFGPGLAGDGVPSYLHVREEPDPRHIPIMMKLWELTERMEVLQSSVRRCFHDFLYCRSHQCRAATVCCRLLTVPCWLHGVCACVRACLSRWTASWWQWARMLQYHQAGPQSPPPRQLRTWKSQRRKKSIYRLGATCSLTGDSRSRRSCHLTNERACGRQLRMCVLSISHKVTK